MSDGWLHKDAACNGCGAPIAWRTTPKGKAMPVEIAPSERGNVIVSGDVATVLTRGQIAGARAHGQPLYVSHFTSCSKADDYRRKGKL